MNDDWVSEHPALQPAVWQSNSCLLISGSALRGILTQADNIVWLFSLKGLAIIINCVYLTCSYNNIVTGLQGKRWYFFVWDEDNLEHVANHRIDSDEAEQIFFNRYVITPNKKKHGPNPPLASDRF